jgi:hypothetical protein
LALLTSPVLVMVLPGAALTVAAGLAVATGCWLLSLVAAAV